MWTKLAALVTALVLVVGVLWLADRDGDATTIGPIVVETTEDDRPAQREDAAREVRDDVAGDKDTRDDDARNDDARNDDDDVEDDREDDDDDDREDDDDD